MIPPMIIATRLVINNNKLPRPILPLPKASQIPTTHSGGTNDAAIATHARPADIFLYPRAKNATNQDAKAIPRSIRVGCVLEAISLVTSVRGMTQVRNAATMIHPMILPASKRKDLVNNLLFPVAIEKATHWIGLMIGAISIAHMTTGVALINNHRVAITIESSI